MRRDKNQMKSALRGCFPNGFPWDFGGERERIVPRDRTLADSISLKCGGTPWVTQMGQVRLLRRKINVFPNGAIGAIW